MSGPLDDADRVIVHIAEAALQLQVHLVLLKARLQRGELPVHIDRIDRVINQCHVIPMRSSRAVGVRPPGSRYG